MPDDYTISSLTPVVTINNGDLMELSTEDQTSETGFASVKMTITQLATKLLANIQYATDLETANKTIVGAINSLLDNMSIDYSDLTFPVASGACCSHNGLIYQANQDIPTAEAWNSSHWTQIVLTDVVGSGGGSGGHTILDDSGTALTQRTNLQFKGAYSEDNSGDDTTEVNVVRSMTKAQYEQLSSDEKVGIINVTDEKVTATDLPISANDNTDTKTYIDTGLSGKANKSWTSIGTITDGGTGKNVSAYSEILVIVLINGAVKYNSYVFPVSAIDTGGINITVNQRNDYWCVGSLKVNNGILTYNQSLLSTNWTSSSVIVYGR